MGYVIAAYDETSRSRIAVKRLLPELRDDNSRGMFTREAKLLTQLRHPNIVRGISFGEDDDGPYLVMDLVQGVTLDELIRASPEGISAPIACRILSDTCAGLAAAHELCSEDGELLGLVHRDVTPHNVVLDFEGRTLLFDFGVAKVDRSSRLSKTGEVKGKTGYMSPEQAMGEPLDPRSDLFAVGSLLYELLTGKKMWAGTEMEVLRSLALSSPPALPETVDPALRALYARLVARNVAERPKSATEVALEFERVGRATQAELAALLRERLPERREETRKRLDAAVTTAGASGSKRGVWVAGGVAAAIGIAAIMFAQSGNQAPNRPEATASATLDPTPSTDRAIRSAAPLTSGPVPSVTPTSSASTQSFATTSARPTASVRTAIPKPSASTAPRPSGDVDPNPI